MAGCRPLIWTLRVCTLRLGLEDMVPRFILVPGTRCTIECGPPPVVHGRTLMVTVTRCTHHCRSVSGVPHGIMLPGTGNTVFGCVSRRGALVGTSQGCSLTHVHRLLLGMPLWVLFQGTGGTILCWQCGTDLSFLGAIVVAALLQADDLHTRTRPSIRIGGTGMRVQPPLDTE